MAATRSQSRRTSLNAAKRPDRSVGGHSVRDVVLTRFAGPNDASRSRHVADEPPQSPDANASATPPIDGSALIVHRTGRRPEASPARSADRRRVQSRTAPACPRTSGHTRAAVTGIAGSPRRNEAQFLSQPRPTLRAWNQNAGELSVTRLGGVGSGSIRTRAGEPWVNLGPALVYSSGREGAEVFAQRAHPISPHAPRSAAEGATRPALAGAFASLVGRAISGGPMDQATGHAEQRQGRSVVTGAVATRSARRRRTRAALDRELVGGPTRPRSPDVWPH